MTWAAAWRAIRNFWPALVAAAALGWAKWQRHQGVRQGKAEERQRATTQAWEQAHEAERRRIADDAARNTADARERLRNLAKRRGEWPE